MRAALAIALLSAAGCYSPSAPSGSYQCAANDDCPSNLSCQCGACVSDAAHAACSLDLKVVSCPRTEGTACATYEGAPVQVSVQARGADGQPSLYSGPVLLGSSWGHARSNGNRSTTVHLDAGTATVELTLDRATPDNTTAVLSASVGSAYGVASTSVIVDPPPYSVDAAPLVDLPFGWVKASIGLPAIDHQAGGGYTMFFSALADSNAPITIGRATSNDGVTWLPDSGPLITSPKDSAYFSPALLHTPDGLTHLFFSRKSYMNNAFPSAIYGATYDGRNVTEPMLIADATSCNGCLAAFGIGYPWAIVDPASPKLWKLYMGQLPANAGGSYLGLLRTIDGGQTWKYDGVPTPGGGAEVIETAAAPRVIYDARDRIYRMWYGRYDYPAGHALFDPCKTSIRYATSDDGQFWTVSRGKGFAVGDVPWLRSMPGYTGLTPSAVQVPDEHSDHYRILYSPIVNYLNVACIPYKIGRLTRP